VDAVTRRNEELARHTRNMRVAVGRLEELIDAPHSPELAAQVAARLGVEHLTDADVARELIETQQHFLRLCRQYFDRARSKVYGRTRVDPVVVTSHLPSLEPEAYLGFFRAKLDEDFTKVNRDHIGDMLFRMAVVKYREAGARPSGEQKRKMHSILYGKRDEGLHRRLAAERRGMALTSRFTDFEPETKARFWSVALEPEDVGAFFEHLMARHLSRSKRRETPPDYYVHECAPLADGMRLMMRFDVPRYKNCYRAYKQRFTAFLLDERLERIFAVPLLRHRHRCGIRSRSIVSRAGEKKERYDLLRSAVEEGRG